MIDYAYRLILKEVEQTRYCTSNLCTHPLLHIDTQILTNHSGKILRLQCFGCNKVAISEAQINI